MRQLTLLTLLLVALAAGCGGGGGGDTNPINVPGGDHGTSTYDPPVTTPPVETYLNAGSWKASCLDTLPAAIYQNESLATWARLVYENSNSTRVANGAGTLIRSAGLDRIAQAQARDMALRRYFAHATPEGVMPWDRIALAGLKDYSVVIDGKVVSDISYNGVGENASKGRKSAADVIQGWMNSTGHRANLLNPIFTHVGTGVYFDPTDAELPMHAVQLYVQAQ
jgi:uncharacterized protein YkwD